MTRKKLPKLTRRALSDLAGMAASALDLMWVGPESAELLQRLQYATCDSVVGGAFRLRITKAGRDRVRVACGGSP